MQAYYAQFNASISLRAILELCCTTVVYATLPLIDALPAPPDGAASGARGRMDDYDFTAHAAYSLDATEDAALSRKLDQDIHDALLLLSCICIGILLIGILYMYV